MNRVPDSSGYDDLISGDTGGYVIRVKGCLCAEVIAQLDWPGKCDEVHGEAIILMAPADQAALYGLLFRMRDIP
jgi:hypothetical protein